MLQIAGMRSNTEAIKGLNMEAISFLKRGEISDAISTFKRALRTMKASLPEIAELTINFEDEGPTAVSIASPAVSSEGIVDDEGALARILADTEDLFDFYPRTFQMLTPTCYSHHNRSIVVLLYNIAVAYDLNAGSTEDPKIAASCLETARQLYSSALDVAMANWAEDDLVTMRCVLLAIVNNLGRLHGRSFDFQRTRFCLTMAVSLLDSVETPEWINDEDLRPLIRSVGPYCVLNQSLLTVAPFA
jgi:hypothetical protein